MTSKDDFEPRFEQRLRRFAALAETRPEPEVVVRAVAARSSSGASRDAGRAFQPRIGTANARSRTLLLVAVLAVGSIATAVVAGGFPQAPVVAPATSPPPAAIATPIPSLEAPVHVSALLPGRLGHLAYGLDGSIYVANSNGTNPVRIAHGAFEQGGAGPGACGSYGIEGPMWSPDGRHLAYRSAWDASCHGTPGAGNVYLSDPAGKVVASFPGIGWLVSWSPDATRVATWVGTGWADLGRTIAIYGLDGVRQELLSVPPGCAEPGDFDPVWSADGNSLVVVGCVVPLDGRTPHSVSPSDPGSLGRSAFSPDGAWAVYTWANQLIVAAADGSQSRALVSTGAGSPHWAPTGDRIAFVGTEGSGQDELDVVDVATGQVTSLASSTATGHLDVIGFAPEGDRILFSRSDSNFSATSLWSIGVGGSAAQLLVAGANWGDWQWLPASP